MKQIIQGDKRFSCCNRFHDRKMKKLFTFASTQGSRKEKSVKRKIDKAMRIMVKRLEWLVGVGGNFVVNARKVPRGTDNLIYGMLGELESMLPKVAHVARQPRHACGTIELRQFGAALRPACGVLCAVNWHATTI
jgi:hypothetical protein